MLARTGVVKLIPAAVEAENNFAAYAGMPLMYTDFQVSAGTVLRAQDFCWEDHGYSLTAKYFPSAAECLDRLFNVAANMTYQNLGDIPTDTGPFRRAIWYICHRVAWCVGVPIWFPVRYSGITSTACSVSAMMITTTVK
jgi:hypothetical protein